MQSFLGALFLLLIASCGERDPDVKKPTPTPAPNQNNPNGSLQLNGKTPADFYNGFLYSDSGTGNSKYKFIYSDSQPIGEKAKVPEEQLCANFSLFLMADKSFTLDYREFYCKKSAAHPDDRLVLFPKRLGGKWQINKTDLQVGDLLIGTGGKYSGNDVINFHFTRAIRTANLQTPLFVGLYVSSNLGVSGN